MKKSNNVIVKKTIKSEILEKLDYDDTPLVDENGNIVEFNDASSDTHDKNHLLQVENRKKIKLILELKEYAATLNFKKKTDLYNELAMKFNISSITAKKYIILKNEEIPDPNKPKKH